MVSFELENDEAIALMQCAHVGAQAATRPAGRQCPPDAPDFREDPEAVQRAGAAARQRQWGDRKCRCGYSIMASGLTTGSGTIPISGRTIRTSSCFLFAVPPPSKKDYTWYDTGKRLKKVWR